MLEMQRRPVFTSIGSRQSLGHDIPPHGVLCHPTSPDMNDLLFPIPKNFWTLQFARKVRFKLSHGGWVSSGNVFHVCKYRDI